VQLLVSPGALSSGLCLKGAFAAALQYTISADGVTPIPKAIGGPGPVCAVVMSASPPPSPGAVTSYVLGDPFLAKFPATFFGKGVIASTGTRGVPLSVGPAAGGGNGGAPEDDICFYGTVAVRAHPSLLALRTSCSWPHNRSVLDGPAPSVGSQHARRCREGNANVPCAQLLANARR
jgi:hypothetical protein